MLPPVNPAGRPPGKSAPAEAFVPDLSEGAETGVYLALLELLDEGLIITGDEVIVDANSAACRLLGREYRQVAGRPLAELFPSEQDFLATRSRLFIQGEQRGLVSFGLAEGGQRTLQVIAAPRLRPGIHALILSPAPTLAADAEPAAGTDAVWPRLAAAVSQPVLVVDDRNIVHAANAAALAALGVEREALVGRPAGACLGVIWPADGGAPVAQLAPAPDCHLSARVLPGPRRGWRILLLPHMASPPVTTTAATAAARPAQSAEARAMYLACHDMLTGLPNRRLFEAHFGDSLARAVGRCGSIGVLRIDLDNFKAVNQAHGDAVGDAALRQLAPRLSVAAGQNALVARERSDSFLVLLPDLDLTSMAGRCADALLAAVAQPLPCGEHTLQLSASIGVALFPQDGRSLEALLRNARTALAHAHRVGGNNFQYFRGLPDNPGEDEDYFEAGLRDALAHDRLALHFQPLVDARSGALQAGEALLRWQHPELGLLPFRRFIGAVSDPGLHARIGDWVLRRACRNASAWPAHGAPLRVTVNVAVEQLMHGDFARNVREALQDSGLAAERLELDLDEKVLEEDGAGLHDTLRAISAMGVRLAVDDFGRGLSSIPRLKRYPVKALKLDPALVRDVGKSEESEAIVEAIASMAGTLGLDVFARGVEDAAQQAFLCALDCHLQQGPLFGRPLPEREFAVFLETAPPGQAPGRPPLP